MLNKDFKHVGNIDVDAGCVWLGDPCYIIHNDDPSEDLGKTWHEFVDKFLDRLGYTESVASYDVYLYNATLISHGFDPDQATHSIITTGFDRYIFDINSAEKIAVDQTKVEQFKKLKPYKEEHYKGFANFGDGTGIAVDTNYGDGSYPVYIKYGKNGRPSQILIDFGDE